MIFDSLVESLARTGAHFRIHEHVPMRTVSDHRAQLPFDTARYLKVLAFRIGEARWALVALRGEDRLDYRALADAAGVPRGALAAASPEQLTAVFGCEPGAVCPVPAHLGIEVFLDRDAAAIDTAYTGSGRSNRTLEIRMEDLLRIVNPRVLRLRREDPA